jgi:hypothetical protein
MQIERNICVERIAERLTFGVKKNVINIAMKYNFKYSNDEEKRIINPFPFRGT